ncbi:MAG: nucleotidyl transferase AbiEii/AbiGii toxin family protein, partial [Nitrospira sp.]|nr:nucleotidyl transferase AbiEii/AbiGii toxin family protein [Nitrospira sp.]
YNALVGYRSFVGPREETIKIEVGLREPLLHPVVSGEAKTILLDPVSGRTLIPPKKVRCISRAEAFAEKFRAAFTRREVPFVISSISTTPYRHSAWSHKTQS